MQRLFILSGILALAGCSGSSDTSDAPTPPAPPTNSPATFSGDLLSRVSANASSATGSVSVADPDQGQASIVAQSDQAGSYGSFSITSSGQWTYTVNAQAAALIALPEDVEVIDSFAISSADNTSNNVAITLVGINDTAVFTTGDGVNSISITNQQSESVSGALSVSDPDTDQSSLNEQSNTNTTYGTFSIDAAGVWVYTLDTGNTSVQTLQSDDTNLVDSITVASVDSSSTTVVITISGTQMAEQSGLQKGFIGTNDQVPAVNCTTTVSTTSALEDAASFNMTPGETICLASGTYSGLDLTFGGAGSADMPITIAAEVPGTVTINGEVFVGMTGTYAVLQGFIFRDGTIDNSLLQTRANSNTPCNNCRITENVFLNMDSGIDDSTKWFQIYGSNNRFDHNWVSGKTTRGALFVIERGDAPGTEDRTQIDHNYFGDRPPKDGLAYAEGSDNEYEGIRIGSSSTHTSDSFAVVEHNYFEAIDGEAEVISIKAGNVTVQHNTIRNSRGSIVNRHGEGAIIANNFIIGDGNPFSGGIRIVDADHSIVNNYIEGARYLSTNFNGGILVSNSDGSTSNGYQDVENVLVAHNTVVDSVNSINLYAGTRNDRPESVYFVNNIVADAIGPVIRNADTLPNNSTYAGNYVYGQSFSDEDVINSLDGFTFIDPMLATTNEGVSSDVLRPNENSPSLNANTIVNIGDFAFPLLDLDGQTRSSNTISGADELLDQVLDATQARGILSPQLVGPLSYDPPAVSLSISAVSINNADFSEGDLSDWTAVNSELLSSRDDTFSGNSTAQVSGASGSLTQTVSIQTNTNYTLSAFVAGKGKLSAQLDNETASVDNDSSNFRFQSVSFNSGSNTEVDIMAQVDDSELYSVNISNPNFDDDQNGWVVNEGTGIGQVQDSDNSSSSTNGSIKFKHNDADSGTPYQPYIAQTVNVEPNTEYTLELYVLLKSNDAQDATVLFGAHTGSAVQDDTFDINSVISSKNSVYASLDENQEAEDSFRPDSITFNSGANSTITIFAQYQSTEGDDIRIDQFSLTSSGAPSDDTKAKFDDFRLVSHPNL